MTNGAQLTGPAHLPVGYSITADDVRLHAFHHGATLHRDEIVELHAALTAWLTLNPANSPRRDTARQAEKQPRKR
ncbi:hypothetical protein ACFYO2_19580 [Streptomyces sp. NPDC006602]|uniref:hypothetical protein n=1 Tax=Streptomyces sp. NPDC006602 TaxID=3364751 RepID=UPI003678853B